MLLIQKWKFIQGLKKIIFSFQKFQKFQKCEKKIKKFQLEIEQKIDLFPFTIKQKNELMMQFLSW